MALTARRPLFDIDELVRDDRVHRRLYVDPAIFDAEMRFIFERTWVFVGHESEIPEPGDFKTAYLGKNIASAGTPPEQFAFDAFASDFTGGVFVG